MKQLSTRLLLSAGSYLALLAIAPPRAFAQTNLDPVQQQWADVYTLPNMEVTALKVATDAAGNVYTLSQTRLGRNTAAGYLTTKYTPNGTLAWRNAYSSGSQGGVGQLGGSIAADLVVDAAGNVYVTGSSSAPVTFQRSFSTVKYATTGEQLWVAQYEAPGFILASAIALDQAGNVYVAGNLASTGVTVKYSSSGQQLWASVLDSGGFSQINDLAVDAAGNAVVTGSVSGDYLTVRYNPAGQQQWTNRYDSGGADEAVAVGLDAAGNAVITGTSATDYATVRYTAAGQQQWVARYNGPGNSFDNARDLALDAAGNAYVTGASVGASGRRDFATLKYSASGQPQWEARFNDLADGYFAANAIALDATGNAYVTGSGNSSSASEFVTIKYGLSGERRWLARYRLNPGQLTPYGTKDARDLALDPQGNVLVTGNAYETSILNGVATVKYTQGTPSTGCNPLATEPSVLNQQLATAAGAPLTFTTASLLMGASDPLGRTLQVASIAKPSVGTLVKNADGSYTYTPQPGYSGPVTLSYVVQEAGPVLASPQTKHYYEFVSAPGINWTQAKAAAAARSYQGLQGYLATITYQGEQNFVSGRQTGQYWLGASDETTEGEWRWTTGPEAGTLIWRGNASGYGTAYTNWQPGQPDDYKNQYRPQGEDYSLFYGQSGYWNDVDVNATGTSVAGYLVEYGGLESCTPVLFTLGTLTIQVGNTSAAMMARVTGGSPTAATAAQPVGLALEAMPNPSHGQFRVRVTATQDGPAQLELFDVQGRQVRALYSGNLAAGETRELAVDDASLAAGLYQLRLRSAEGTRTLRLSIQP